MSISSSSQTRASYFKDNKIRTTIPNVQPKTLKGFAFVADKEPRHLIQGGEDFPYLTHTEQNECTVHFESIDNKTYMTNTKNEKINTSEAIFVILEDDRLIVCPEFYNNQDRVHLSLSQGEPIKYAGEITIQNGRIKNQDHINLKSGHYQQPETLKEYLLEKFGNLIDDYTHEENEPLTPRFK